MCKPSATKECASKKELLKFWRENGKKDSNLVVQLMFMQTFINHKSDIEHKDIIQKYIDNSNQARLNDKFHTRINLKIEKGILES